MSAYVDFGTTGLPIYSGRVYDEDLSLIRGQNWNKVIRDMQNDPVIGAFLFAIEMLTRNVSWSIEPFSDSNEDKKRAIFIEECLFKDMSITWQDTLPEILSMLPYGWSLLEECYKPRNGENKKQPHLTSNFNDGKIGWRKLSIRSQDTLNKWDFDDFNELRGFEQIAPPDYRTCYIPSDKFLLFRTTSHKENPEGKTIFRRAYRPWYFKANIENIEGIGIERDLAGLPVLYVPPEILREDATESQKQLLTQLKTLVRSIKRDENEGVIAPMAYDQKTGNQTYKLELLSTGGQRQFDTTKIIERYDQRILMLVMADFLLLGSKQVGSYALSTDKTELFSSALGAWLDSICNVFNRFAIPRLEKLNGEDPKTSPKLTHGSIEKVSLLELGEYISKLSGKDITFNEEQQNWLKKQTGMPVKQK